jgi:X-Pro dipeptidyl-peptidase
MSKPTTNVTQWRVTRGILDSSNRDSLDTPTLMTPGATARFRFPLQPEDYTFKAGHQIAVTVVGDYRDVGTVGTSGATIGVDTKSSKVFLPIVGGYPAAVASGAFAPDTVAPAQTVPSDIVVVTEDPDAVVTYPAPGVTDNEDPAPTSSCDHASGSRFPHGVTTVTCTARDASGNTRTDTFKVTVKRDGEETAPQGDIPAPPAPAASGEQTPLSPAPQSGPSDASSGPSPTLDNVDRLAPKLAGLQLRAAHRSLRLNFKLSEPATVTVTINRRGSKKVLKTVKSKLDKGKRSLTVRSSKLGKGRYTVTIVAVDAAGNKSKASRPLTMPR